MNIKAYLPSTPLSPFIKTYLTIENQDERINRVLPDTSPVMAFRYKGQVSYLINGSREILPSLVISGLRKSGRLIHYAKNTGNILVLFKEAGAHAFMKEPLYELAGDSVSLDNITGYRASSTLEDQLTDATSHAQRIDLIERFLLSRLYHPQADTLIASALERIHQAKGIIKITTLADTLCISLDAFEKRFRRVAGISPKQFSYIVRMKSIINGGLKTQSLFETAFDAGYYDQPHFNKDFKLFTGQTPTDFLRSPVFW